MKTTSRLKLAGSVVLVLLSAHASAQTAAPLATSSPTADAKAQYQASKAQYKNAKAANRTLAKNVRNTLVKDIGVDANRITVSAHDGAVVLQGSVTEAAQSDRATEVARGVTGVKSVKNALSVRPAGAS